MIIKSLELKNLERHKDLRLEFKPGITSITGATDAGKSSIFRGLFWAGANADLGAGIVRHHTSNTSVCINDLVTKRRKAGKLTYEMGGAEYANIARENTPEEIAQVLNLSKDNFQGQHDVYFLIGSTGGQVARKLNEVADLQKIDLARNEAKARKRDCDSEINTLQKSVEEIEGKLNDMHWLEEAEALYGRIEEKENQARALQAKQQELATGVLGEAISAAEDLIRGVDPTEAIALARVKLDDLVNADYGELEQTLTSALLAESKLVKGNPAEAVNKARAITKALDSDKVERLSQSLDLCAGASKKLVRVDPTQAIAKARKSADAIKQLKSNSEVEKAVATFSKASSELANQPKHITKALEKSSGLFDKVTAAAQKVASASKLVESNREAFEDFKGLKALDIDGTKAKLSASLEEIERAEKNISALTKANSSACDCAEALTEAKAKEAKAKEEFKENSQGYCPLCHGKIKSENILGE